MAWPVLLLCPAVDVGLQLKQMYLQAITHGIPAQLQTGDFWDAIEVKIATALLRAVVFPEAATEGLKRRVIGSSSDVKVPLTTGLGASHSVCVKAQRMCEGLPAPYVLNTVSCTGSAQQQALMWFEQRFHSLPS
jgi:hypothetical protein